MLGQLWADGHLRVSQGGYRLIIETADEAVPRALKRIVGSRHPVTVRTRRENYQPHYKIQIGRIRRLGPKLEALGMRLGGKDFLEPPHISFEHAPGFARGFLDGDGDVGIRWSSDKRPGRTPHPRLVVRFNGQLPVLKWIQEWFSNEDVVGSLHSKQTEYGTRVWTLEYSTKAALQIYHLLYSDGCLCLERKRQIFEKFIQPAQ